MGEKERRRGKKERRREEERLGFGSRKEVKIAEEKSKNDGKHKKSTFEIHASEKDEMKEVVSANGQIVQSENRIEQATNLV